MDRRLRSVMTILASEILQLVCSIFILIESMDTFENKNVYARVQDIGIVVRNLIRCYTRWASLGGPRGTRHHVHMLKIILVDFCFLEFGESIQGND